MPRIMRVLYAGDSPAGGTANYLLGVLRWLKADVRHVPPQQVLRPQWLAFPYDAIVLSDFSARQTPRTTQRLIAAQVARGTGLLMVGGWASFSGPSGGWRDSLIETLLPVTCQRHDDRAQFASGAVLLPVARHPMLSLPSFAHPPVICGLNRVRPRPGSFVVLSAHPLRSRLSSSWAVPRVSVEARSYPLLVLTSDPSRRVAALTTDLAPHWCGGLVDWGARRHRLRVSHTIHVEVGAQYLRFVASLLSWLGGRLFGRSPPSSLPR